jgi:hypothetical protein
MDPPLVTSYEKLVKLESGEPKTDQIDILNSYPDTVSDDNSHIIEYNNGINYTNARAVVS